MNTPKSPRTGPYVKLVFPCAVQQMDERTVQVEVKPNADIGRKVELFVDGLYGDLKIESEESRNRLEAIINDEILRAQIIDSIRIERF